MDLFDHIFTVYRDTILPELIEVVGFDKMVEIIDIFGGKRIYIPSKDDLKDLIQRGRVYDTLDGLLGFAFSTEVDKLAEDLELTAAQVRGLYATEKEARKRPAEIARECLNPTVIQERLNVIEDFQNFDPAKGHQYNQRSQIIFYHRS